MTPVERLETIIALAGLDPEQFKIEAISPNGSRLRHAHCIPVHPIVSAWVDGSLLVSLPPHDTIRCFDSIEDVVAYIRGAQ